MMHVNDDDDDNDDHPSNVYYLGRIPVAMWMKEMHYNKFRTKLREQLLGNDDVALRW